MEPSMKCPSACALTFALMLGLGAFPAPAQTAHGKASPSWKLLAESERAMTTIAEAARKSPVGLRAGSPQYAPFWDSMEEMDRALAEVESSMGQRNQQFFQALRSGSRALAQLRVVWPRTGVQDPAVALGLESLGSSYRQLRTRFGPEQGRYRQGGELSEQEKHNFREIQRAQLRFIALLQPLRFQAEKRGDRAMVAHLDRILDQAEQIVDANPTLDEYLEASMAEDEIIGEWDGNAPYAESTYKTAWHQADAAVEELYVSAEAGFVFSVNLGDPEPGAGPAGPRQEGGQEGEAQAQAGTMAPGVTVFQPIGEPAAPDAEPAPAPESAPEAAVTEGDLPEGAAPESPAPEVPEAATETVPGGAPDIAAEIPGAAGAPEASHEVIEEGAPEESYDISEEDLPVTEAPAESAKADKAADAPPETGETVKDPTAEKPKSGETKARPAGKKAAETKAAPSSSKKTKPAAKSTSAKTTRKKPRTGTRPLASVHPH
jgi:hypothetical protein